MTNLRLRESIEFGPRHANLFTLGSGKNVILVVPSEQNLFGSSATLHEMYELLAQRISNTRIQWYELTSPRRGVSQSPRAIQHDVELIDAIRQRSQPDALTLLGVGWGGFKAMAYAASLPDDLTSLVLVDSIGPAYNEWNVELRRVVQPYAKHDQIDRWRQLETILAPQPQNYNQIVQVNHLIKEMMQIYTSSQVNEWPHRQSVLLSEFCLPYLQNDDNYARRLSYQATYFSQSLNDRLRRITCPVLVVQGDRECLPLARVSEYVRLLDGVVRLEIQIRGIWDFVFRQNGGWFVELVSSWISRLDGKRVHGHQTS